MEEIELSARDARAKAEKLIGGLDVVFVATNGSHGHPNVRAMAPIRVDSLDLIWFATSLESSKIIELVKDHNAVVYGYSPETLAEFRLWGSVAIMDDHETRSQVWCDELKEHFEGPDDPNMRVLKFVSVSGKYAHAREAGSF